MELGTGHAGAVEHIDNRLANRLQRWLVTRRPDDHPLARALNWWEEGSRKRIRKIDNRLPRRLGILVRQRQDIIRHLLCDGTLRRTWIRQSRQIRIEFGGGPTP